MDTAYKAADAELFQSTPSARRATLGVHHTTIYRELFQSTPSARRATDSDLLISVEDDISIHALREEGDDV